MFMLTRRLQYPTIAVVMAVLYGSVGAVLLGGAFPLIIVNHPMLALISAIISVYFWVEAGRWAYWREIHYHSSDDTQAKSPPQNLIKKLFCRLT